MLESFSLRSAVAPLFSAVFAPTSVAPAAVVKPSDVVDVPYAPALLLDVHFPIVVVADEGFSTACKAGFDVYFEEMMHGTFLEELHMEDHFYTWGEVEWMVRDLLSPASGDRLPWRAGFCLGWLSALALTNRSLAGHGVELLCSQATAEYCSVC